MLLLIDNYDSFTYNLVQYFQTLGQQVCVALNDAITIEDIEHLSPSALVISPGPHGPEKAGISLKAIQAFYQSIPILGVCLGHQCLAHAFGGNIIQAPVIMHGKTTSISHTNQGLFRGLPHSFQVMRYHSLMIDASTLPEAFTIDAWSDNVIMAISHRQYPLFGVQFHPESILSEHGLDLLSHFLNTRTLS